MLARGQLFGKEGPAAPPLASPSGRRRPLHRLGLQGLGLSSEVWAGTRDASGPLG